MSQADADFIQNLIQAQQTVTNPHEQWVQRQVALWRALRENDLETLKSLIDWPGDRRYVIDPLPQKVAEAFADLLFGEDPTITSAEANQEEQAQIAQARSGGPTPAPAPAPASTPGKRLDVDEEAIEGPDLQQTPDLDQAEDEATNTDQDWLDDLIEANDLPSEIRRAEEVCSSEGEVWWRVYVDRMQMSYPILEWHSRAHVRPYFRGRRLIGAAFVSDIHREEVPRQETVIYKYVQIQTSGYIRNLLYRGTVTQLGTIVPLTDRPETAELVEDWQHGFDMLCGRIPNKLGSDRRYGISDFAGVKELIFALNEASTIGSENVRLVAKKRIVVPPESLDETGRFDAGEDVLVATDALDQELGQKGQSAKFAVLEYTFDAQQLIEYKADLAAIILTRVGIAENFINSSSRSSSAGMAMSGTALRLRLIPTTLAAQGKARFWDDAMPKILMLMQLIDALDESQGGFGRNWKRPGEPPVFERQEPLPQDEQEQVSRHVMAVGGEIESRKTAITDLHGDWTEEQVQAEIEQIDTEMKEFGALKPGAGGGLSG